MLLLLQQSHPEIDIAATPATPTPTTPTTPLGTTPPSLDSKTHIFWHELRKHRCSVNQMIVEALQVSAPLRRPLGFRFI